MTGPGEDISIHSIYWLLVTVRLLENTLVFRENRIFDHWLWRRWIYYISSSISVSSLTSMAIRCQSFLPSDSNEVPSNKTFQKPVTHWQTIRETYFFLFLAAVPTFVSLPHSPFFFPFMPWNSMPTTSLRMETFYLFSISHLNFIFLTKCWL